MTSLDSEFAWKTSKLQITSWFSFTRSCCWSLDSSFWCLLNFLDSFLFGIFFLFAKFLIRVFMKWFEMVLKCRWVLAFQFQLVENNRELDFLKVVFDFWASPQGLLGKKQTYQWSGLTETNEHSFQVIYQVKAAGQDG